MLGNSPDILSLKSQVKSHVSICILLDYQIECHSSS